MERRLEAVIALSIAFVACELILMKPGERRLSEAYPLVVAFSFGLLHGFGFAGAPKEIGLPHGDVPLALVTFNLSVEAVQLIFVAAMLALYRVISIIAKTPLPPLRTLMACGIGATATTWLLTRIGAFIACGIGYS